MVSTHPRAYVSERRVLEHLSAELWMSLDDLELALGELARHPEDAVRVADLPDVVQHAGEMCAL